MSVLDEFIDLALAGRLTTSLPTLWNLPPAEPLSIVVAESALGFALPTLLRDLYLEVANGGFGPGYGLFGLPGGAYLPTNPESSYLVELYRDFGRNRHSDIAWRERLLPICHWGRTWFSCLDCTLPDAPVLDVDIGSKRDGTPPSDFVPHATSFEAWMRAFLDGENLRPNLDRGGDATNRDPPRGPD